MKKILLLLLHFLFLSNVLHAQFSEPVKFKTSAEKISDTEYNLIIKATIEKGWHLYSQFTHKEGSLPIVISNEDSEAIFKLIGKATESKTKKKFNKTFGVEETFFEHTAILKQKIKLLKDVKQVELDFYGQACKEACIQISKTFTFKLDTSNTTSVVSQDNDIKTDTIDAQDSEKNKTEEKSIWTLFILSFLGGLAALLTPCVFPMIPMTVSFFTKQSKNKATGIRNAIIYGLSIIVLYVLLGVFVSKIFGADALNALATNVWFNVIFFILLIFFAISFLGAFEITLPSSWGTKVDKQADRGGIIGIFFMALALAIVSFSCTGPIVGTALVAAASQGGIAPIVSMFGFSLAIALPFTLFAMFPGWLNSLPKSGGWLNTVKVVLGFLELALAFKFLSNADLVLQLHWFEREVFIAIWIAVFGTLALYLFGKIQLPHDSPLQHISVGRLLLGLVILSFTVYMIPGLWGAPLKMISGFPPPASYSESPYGVGFTKLGASTSSANHDNLPKGAHLLAPYDIMAFNDYNTGLAYAKKVGKPIMIDFTGYACVNCRKMEDNIWPDAKILPILKNDIILISLHVDDKRKLPKSEQYKSEITGKKIRTIGNKWSEFQEVNYKTNSQPYYVLINHEEQQLNKPSAYNSSIDAYYNWLQEGLQNFEKKDTKQAFQDLFK